MATLLMLLALLGRCRFHATAGESTSVAIAAGPATQERPPLRLLTTEGAFSEVLKCFSRFGSHLLMVAVPLGRQSAFQPIVIHLECNTCCRMHLASGFHAPEGTPSGIAQHCRACISFMEYVHGMASRKCRQRERESNAPGAGNACSRCSKRNRRRDALAHPLSMAAMANTLIRRHIHRHAICQPSTGEQGVCRFSCKRRPV